jgi:hypothetical protein
LSRTSLITVTLREPPEIVKGYGNVNETPMGVLCLFAIHNEHRLKNSSLELIRKAAVIGETDSAWYSDDVLEVTGNPAGFTQKSPFHV